MKEYIVLMRTRNTQNMMKRKNKLYQIGIASPEKYDVLVVKVIHNKQIYYYAIQSKDLPKGEKRIAFKPNCQDVNWVLTWKKIDNSVVHEISLLERMKKE